MKKSIVRINMNNAHTAQQMPINFLMLFMMIQSVQSIGSVLLLTRYSLVLEKCLQPRNPLCAERGEGCAAFNTRCFVSSIRACFSWANLPHNKKTRFFLRSDNLLIAAFVNSDHPMREWLMGSCARTVSD